jgi:lambda family phage portal protein
MPFAAGGVADMAGKTVMAMERIIDRGIGILFPGVEANRIADRVRCLNLRQYAAAKESRLTGQWTPVSQDINSLIRTGNPTIRDRTRQLVRDFAYFARAVNVLVDFTVGTGITFQSRVTRGTTANGKSKLHSKAIRQIEDAWKRWIDEADTAGKLHYHDLERLWKRQDVECGESLMVKVWDNRPGRFLPLTLQMYEPDWLTSDYARAEGNNLLDQGLEYDPQTGRVVAYHFAVPSGYNMLAGSAKVSRITAENVIHGFETLRPGQLRGISKFTPAILLADDLQEFLGANIDRAKMASKWLAFVETGDAAGWQMGRTQDDGSGRRTMDIDNAIIDFLKPGEKVSINSSDVPGDSFGPYTRFILQMVAVATGVTYELLSGDYQGLNYNTTRTVRNDFYKMCRPSTNRHIRQYSRPVFKAFMDACHLSGRLNLPGYSANPFGWLECLWQPPGVEPLDLLRESRGHIDLVNNLLFSPQEIASARGRDLEDIYNEAAEAKAMADDRGLEKASTSKALQTNPAAIAAGKKDQSKTEQNTDPDPEEV